MIRSKIDNNCAQCVRIITSLEDIVPRTLALSLKNPLALCATLISSTTNFDMIRGRSSPLTDRSGVL